MNPRTTLTYIFTVTVFRWKNLFTEFTFLISCFEQLYGFMEKVNHVFC